ncbi:MAG: NifB/NifX family molybdenum-iron cluster-binding protein [Clostridia bacterium]|nr:NifB/NifX family molybdenum-iron cluster-binding protein [Clostridia bacterium]
MKIAVTYENGQVFQHFGHTENFKLYTIDNGAVAESKVISAGGSGHGALAGMLMMQGVDTVICGGIGGGAQMALKGFGIKVYGGVQGDADAAVEALLQGTLVSSENPTCNHHHDHHHEEGHACGDHGCGGHCHE